MPSFNKVILAGHLTRDPEMRYLPKGTAIAKIGLALNRQWKSESGEKKEEVIFVDVDVFGKQAETLSQYCKKGSALLVEGRLKLDTWEDKQTNQKRQKLGVILESFQFLSSSKGQAKDEQDPAENFPKEKPQPQSDPEPTDSVPF